MKATTMQCAREALAVSALACALFGSIGCKRASHDGDAPTNATAPTVIVEHPPPDHLAQDELIEGKDHALVFVLPRKMKVELRYGDVVTARGNVPTEQMLAYVRSHSHPGTVTTKGDETTFEAVKFAAEPAKTYRIRVRAMQYGQRTSFEIRDVTAPPVTPGLSEEERWRQVGVTKDGRLLDPQHLM